MRRLSTQDFGGLFRNFRTSAVRLETLPAYLDDEETADLAAWKAGTLTRNENTEWIHTIRAATERGATITRIRVIGDPPTDYERFELDRYQASAHAGEHILIHPHRRVRAPRNLDAWIFDDSVVVEMDYDADGRFQGGWGGTHPDDLARAQFHLDYYRKLAVPLADYLTIAGVK